MEYKLNLSINENKDLISYCNLNDLRISEIIKKSYLDGFNIERYGLLSGSGEVKEIEVIKETIKYIEVPVIEEKEIIRVEYIETIKEIEVIKEVPIETIVTKIEYICDNSQVDELLLKIQELENKPPKVIESNVGNDLKPKLDALQNTVQKLKQDNIDKDKLIREYEQTIKDIQTHQQDTKAFYLKGSNLDDKLYR